MKGNDLSRDELVKLSKEIELEKRIASLENQEKEFIKFMILQNDANKKIFNILKDMKK